MDFEGIYQSYCKDVFRYLRSLSAGEDLAEEITQETFAKALKAIDQFQGDKDIRAWLFTIAKHTYYTHCKREKRTTGEEFPPSIPGPEKPLVEQIIDRERATGETSGGTDHRPGASLSGPPVSARDAGAVQGGVYPAGVWGASL